MPGTGGLEGTALGGDFAMFFSGGPVSPASSPRSQPGGSQPGGSADEGAPAAKPGGNDSDMMFRDDSEMIQR